MLIQLKYRNLTFKMHYVSIINIQRGCLKMQKEKMVKKIALIGMYGLLSSSLLTGCQKNSTVKVSESTKEEGRSVENANGEWKRYKNIVVATMEGPNGLDVLLMGLEEESENRKVYRSFRIPEYTLIETYEKETYALDYHLETKAFLPEKNEEFTNQNEVISVAYLIGSLEDLTYEDVLIIEEMDLQNKEEEIKGLRK